MFRRRIGENRVGVSPVIAVILMVAITVVLAGVLYLWVQSFSPSSESDFSYIGTDIKETSNGWEISILNTNGNTVQIDQMKLLIYDNNRVLLYQKTIHEVNPEPFTILNSKIYPISDNASGVISKKTFQPVNDTDHMNDYVGVVFVFNDYNSDYTLNTEDTIRIYNDFDGDGEKDVKHNYYFAIKDMSNTKRFVWLIL